MIQQQPTTPPTNQPTMFINKLSSFAFSSLNLLQTTTTLVFKMFLRIINEINTNNHLSVYLNAVPVLLLVLFIIFFISIKIMHPFWSFHPMFHTYDVWRYFCKTPYVVQKVHPLKNKFFSGWEKVQTYTHQDISDDQMSSFLNLVQCYYVYSENALCVINKKTLNGYFTGQNNSSYISFYTPTNIVSSCSACISSRSCLFLYKHNKQWETHNAYYIDFFSGNKKHKNRVFYELFSSHIYHQLSMNKNVKITFFKKENILCKGIVPFIQYTTHLFLLKNMMFDKLPQHTTIQTINNKNKDLLMNFLDIVTKHNTNLHFSFFVIPDVGVLLSLMQMNILHIFCLKMNEDVLGYYFFKNMHIEQEGFQSPFTPPTPPTTTGVGEGNTLSFVASYCNTQNIHLFYLGFLHSLRNILTTNPHFCLLLFDVLSDNSLILNIWKKTHTTPINVSNTQNAYYLHNFIFPQSPKMAMDCFVLV